MKPPLPFRLHLLQRTEVVLLHLPCVSRLLPALLLDCSRAPPTVLAATLCSQLVARYLIVFRIFLSVSRPQRLCLLCSLLFFFRLTALCSSTHLWHMFSHLSPASVDGLTVGMPVLIHERWPPLFSTFVSMNVRSKPSSLRSVSSSAPSRTTGEVRSFITGSDSRVLQIANLNHLVIVHRDQLSLLLHLHSASFLETLHQHLHRTVASLLLRRELECVDQVVACSVWRSVRSANFCFSAVRAVLCDQDSLRISPVVLATTCCTTSCTAPLLFLVAIAMP